MIEHSITEMSHIGKSLLYDIEKGNLSYDDNKVQYFIPIALHFTEFDWLKLIAENVLIDEDKEIVFNFIDKVQSIMEINSNRMNNDVGEKIRHMMEDL